MSNESTPLVGEAPAPAVIAEGPAPAEKTAEGPAPAQDGRGVASDLRRPEDARKFGEPALGPERPAVEFPFLIKCCLLADFWFRMAVIFGLAFAQANSYCFSLIDLYYKRPSMCTSECGWDIALFIVVEMAVSSWLVIKYARYEQHYHIVTLWSSLTPIMAIMIRHTLFENVWLFLIVLIELIVSMAADLLCDFRRLAPARLPPFPVKSLDKGKTPYGEFGEWMCKTFVSKCSRVTITVLMLFWYNVIPIVVMLYLFIFDCVDPSDEPLDALFGVVCAFSVLYTGILVRNTRLQLLGFHHDLTHMKYSANVYKTGPYDIAKLDDEDMPEGAVETDRLLAKHDFRACTVVLPAFLPNEAEIAIEMLTLYREIEKDYPAPMRVMFVYNTPKDMPEIESKLKDLANEWPALSVHRHMTSTSKCDNLNLAISLLETDLVLLNDTDTIVSAESMKRASLHIFGENKYDIAQCINIHCAEDAEGRPDGTDFCMGGIITIEDSSVDSSKRVQTQMRRLPFNGRGGFWHGDAIKAVCFDYRTVSEDHDSAYRAFTYFGCHGILDPNMMCQERQPPTCGELAKQRIRWESGATEIRRNLVWMLRSEHYDFSQLVSVATVQMSGWAFPWQSLPVKGIAILQLIVVKSFVVKLIDFDTWGTAFTICLFGICVNIPWSVIFLMIALSIMAVFMSVPRFCFRIALVRYKPRWLYAVYLIVIQPTIVTIFFFYVYYCALHDVLWGSAVFICTARSVSSSQIFTQQRSSEALLKEQGKDPEAGLLSDDEDVPPADPPKGDGEDDPPTF